MEVINFSSEHNTDEQYIQKMLKKARQLNPVLVCFTSDYGRTTLIATENKLFVYDYTGKFVYEKHGVLEKTANEYRFIASNEITRIANDYVAVELNNFNMIVCHKSGSFLPIANGIIKSKGDNGYILYCIDKVPDDFKDTEQQLHYIVDIIDPRVCSLYTQYLYNGTLYNLRVNVATNSRVHWQVIHKATAFLKPLFQQIFSGCIQPSDVTFYIKLDTEEHLAIAVLSDIVVVITSGYRCEILPKKEIKTNAYVFYPISQGIAVISSRNYIDVSQVLDINDIFDMERK